MELTTVNGTSVNGVTDYGVGFGTTYDVGTSMSASGTGAPTLRLAAPRRAWITTVKLRQNLPTVPSKCY